ncbi:hypothetical protein HHX38_08640 [Streptomyces sp. PKU-MA01144]|nr:hypothetical protein [Streptomyces sp. PKU-MA01144]
MPASPAARTFTPPLGRAPARGRRRAPRTTTGGRAAAAAPDAPGLPRSGGRAAGRTDRTARAARTDRPARTTRPAGYGTGRPATAADRTPAGDAAAEMVRWATFGCVIVPVVLVAYGTSVGGAAAVTAGLAAVTGVSRALMRRSERAAARPAGPRGHRSGGRRARRTSRG